MPQATTSISALATCKAAPPHQAAGILIDDAGNDYLCVQRSGGAGRGLGSEHRDADRPRAVTTPTPRAAWRWDLQPSRRSRSSWISMAGIPTPAPALACGASGDNTYHYDADKIFSFSVFDRSRRQVRQLPARAREQRADSHRHTQAPNSRPHPTGCGMFVDE